MSKPSYKLKVLSSADYNKLAERYPKKSRQRIKNSWGFTDQKRGVSFVRARKNINDMAGTAIHEILEMAATISPHEEDGLRFKKKATEPQLQYTQSPWEQQYHDFLDPSIRQLGGQLQSDLTQPFSLPEEFWQGLWQKGRERTLNEYAPIDRRQTQRFASTGALDSSGQAQKWFGDLELSKAKSIEDLAIEQTLNEWNEKKMAKQQAITNMGNFVNSSGNWPQQQAYIQPGRSPKINGWESFFSSVSPIYHDVLQGQGYNSPGMGTGQSLALLASMYGMGGMGGGGGYTQNANNNGYGGQNSDGSWG